jgi:hypothetical protein
MTTTNSSLADVWPEGLRSLEWTTFVEKSQFRRDLLEKALRQEVIWHVTRRTELSLPAVGGGAPPGFAGVLVIDSGAPELENWTMIEWRIRPFMGDLPEIPEGARPLEFALIPDFVRRFMEGSDVDPPLIASAKFQFDPSTWKPAIQLPVRLPGVLEGVSGSPEITGFNFRFGTTDSNLRSAKIDVSVPTSIRLDMVTGVEIHPTESLSDRTLSALLTYLPFFVERIPQPTVSDARS